MSQAAADHPILAKSDEYGQFVPYHGGTQFAYRAHGQNRWQCCPAADLCFFHDRKNEAIIASDYIRLRWAERKERLDRAKEVVVDAQRDFDEIDERLKAFEAAAQPA